MASANADGHDFPIQNLPFGVFLHGRTKACGIAIGDFVLHVSQCADAFTGQARKMAIACGDTSLNAVMAMGRGAAHEFRLQLSHLLTAGNAPGRAVLEPSLIALTACEMCLPVRVGGFTDFFASIHHATNAGRLFRPDAPLLPNYKYVPIAYNARANSIQVSGVPVRRPLGQMRPVPSEAPVFGPAARLDYEVELGGWIGTSTARDAPLQLVDAQAHLFGYSLLNDWSARDIQAWEYQPLGPFLAKTFATSVSPWVVTSEALAPFRCARALRPPGDPAPLRYLQDREDSETGGLAVTLEASLRSAAMRETGAQAHVLSTSHSEDLYWTFGQMITHHTSNGSCLETGDLIGSGTISGAQADALGSLLELTRGGAAALPLANGEQRVWLEDGDEVTLRGYCTREGYRRIGFGECVAIVLPACSREN
ncbi:fumarylacetoacetase [Pandoraea cepalis]|uniref:fumarylacetoacetase n=1 Tax=Pandoraea cepalis TaxID=2508294 RepID=UPI003444290A